MIVANGDASVEAISPTLTDTTILNTFSIRPPGDTYIFQPFGLTFAPTGFGADGGDLLVSDMGSGTILAVNAAGAASTFVDLPLANGQTGLRQMAFSPPGFLPGYGSLLFVSVGKYGGGGTLGNVFALDSNGNPVFDLRQNAGLTAFDPRGLIFTSDGHLLINDASDPTIIASASDFVPYVAGAVSEPSTWPLLGLAALLPVLRRRCASH